MREREISFQNRLNKKNLALFVKYGGRSRTVRGCTSAAGVENLMGGIMDKFMHLNILKQNLKRIVQKMGII